MASYQRDPLLLDLKNNVIELTVHQDDGSDRTVRVTHAVSLLPANVSQRFIDEHHRTAIADSSSIVAWAVDMKSWFVFDVEDVRYAQVIDGYL